MPVPAALYPSLRRAGLSGRHMLVALGGERLELRGERGGALNLPIARIERVRVGSVVAEDVSAFETVVWRVGQAAPIRIAPVPPLRDPAAYAAFVRELARRVVDRRGIKAIETGFSPAFRQMLIFGLAAVFVAVILIDLLILVRRPDLFGWGSAAVLIVLVPLVLALWRFLATHRRQPIRHLSDLDTHLPAG